MKRFAPATQRNRQPILQVLQSWLPPQGNILEIASGTGEHAVFFAEQFPNLSWYPSDPNPELRASIQAWSQEYSGTNLHPVLDIDGESDLWQIETDHIAINAILNINMIHISPWTACQGLIRGAKRILGSGGLLYLYGPYKRAGKHTSASNLAFDNSLRDRNEVWGIRDVEQVIAEAAANDLQLQAIIEMPANNLSVVFVHT